MRKTYDHPADELEIEQQIRQAVKVDFDLLASEHSHGVTSRPSIYRIINRAEQVVAHKVVVLNERGNRLAVIANRLTLNIVFDYPVTLKLIIMNFARM